MTTSPAAFEIMDQDGRTVMSVGPATFAYQPGPPAHAHIREEVYYSWRWVAAWFLTGAALGSIITAIIDRVVG